MTDTLVIGGKTYTGVTGIKATDSNDVTQTFTKGGGGSSDWELVASKEITVNTTSTSATTIEWWDTEKTSIWTSDKMVYIRIRDKEGKRNGYFYGSDTCFINEIPSFGQSSSQSYGMRTVYRVDSNGKYRTYTTGASTGYGVYVQSIEDTGSIRLMSRFSTTYTLTINGTYTVEVYLLSPPTGKPFFT